MQADGDPRLLGEGAEGGDGPARAPGDGQSEPAIAKERPARGVGAAVHEGNAALGQSGFR